jgi:uncharacterized peroxidase-related enzyme
LSHARDFAEESGETAVAEQLIYDYRTAPLDPARRAFCDYAVKLTLRPGDMTGQDVQGLREAGFSDAQISLGVQVISYFNYINRVADGLGVDDEPWMELSPQAWKQRKANFADEAGPGQQDRSAGP